MQSLCKPGRAARQTVSVFAFVLALAITANAYTVVMRGGRQVEIPAQFVVTTSTLTYEVSAGVQVTMLMAAINIPATEKANNEPAGSLLRRAELTAMTAAKTPTEGIPTAPGTATVRRTITNRDLESTTLRRRQSELAYEDRRKQLGLPSVEESRRQADAESELIQKELEEQRLANNKTEDYWRERAAALRTELAALNGEIAWIRARLDEGPAPNTAWNGWSGASFTTLIGVSSFGGGRGGRVGNVAGGNNGGNFGRSGGFHSGRSMRPGVFVAPNSGPQLSGRVPFGGGATRGRVLINPGLRGARPSRVAGGLPIFCGAFPCLDQFRRTTTRMNAAT